MLHDSLTGLLNREGLKDRLNDKLEQSKKCAVAFLDLDDFKEVNDLGGHEKGNATLKEIADKLSQNLPEGGIASRLSGDEFLVAFDYKGMHDLKATSDRLLRKIATEGPKNLTITASMGIALYPEHSEKASELMSFADKAMYTAKEKGKNTYVIHNF